MDNLKPSNDFVFKKLFGTEKNKDILKDLLEAILPDIEIKKIHIKNDVPIEREMLTDKFGILDILATLNDDTLVNIEMQVKNYYNTIERSIFYGSSEIRHSLSSGEKYEKIPSTICIWITDYDVFENGPYHERALLRRDFENIILTNKIQYHYIQLPKFKRKCKRINTKLEQWLAFILNDSMEEIRSMDNDKIQKAEDELEHLSSDEQTIEFARLREKAIRDEQAALAKARSDGMQIGIERGIEQGIERGIEQGIQSEKIALAKKMLELNVDISIIIQTTELSKEEIESLKSTNNL